MSAQKISNAERNEASVRKLNDMLTPVPQRLNVPYDKTPNTSNHKSIRKHQIDQIDVGSKKKCMFDTQNNQTPKNIDVTIHGSAV